MQNRTIGVIVLAAAMLTLQGLAATPQHTRIREEKTVLVDGVKEIWQLRWESDPISVCGVDDVESAMSCPCSGFAFGEGGKLALIRRHGAASEKLELDSLFVGDYPLSDSEKRVAVIQRWKPQENSVYNDWLHAHDPRLAPEVRSREPSDIMNFADYDHDGRATEFLIQVETLPCGKHQMVLVGISKSNPHLHAFTTAETPQSPLMLASWEWEAMRTSAGPVTVTDWECNDHGSEFNWEVDLDARSGVLHAKRSSFACTDPSHADGPVQEVTL